MDSHDEYRRTKRAERERKRKEAREAAEKKKRFGLTPEKKRRLRQLIRQKASEDLKLEASVRAKKKVAYLEQKVIPLQEDIDSLSESDLKDICRDLHNQLSQCESDKYDIEFKIRGNDYEINELTVKVNDIKGKFIKPTLNKVSQVEGKMQKIWKKEKHEDFRENLKSTGINKFALDENAEKEKVDFRGQLKSTT
ncbi:hypothetical protein ACOME3_000099 [Neoechinorhynchus agilis]